MYFLLILAKERAEPMEPTILWLLVAAVGLVLFGLGIHRLFKPILTTRNQRRNELADLGMTPLQKRAWWSLGIGLVISTAIVIVMTTWGPTTSFMENKGLRLVTTALFLVGMGSYYMLIPNRRKADRAGVFVDERDHRILAQATSVQLLVAFITLGAWAIALTEVYWQERSIPIVFPYLVLWSTFLVSLLGASIGILLGYAGWGDHAEG